MTMTSTADESKVKSTVSTRKAQSLHTEKQAAVRRYTEETTKKLTAREKLGRKTNTVLLLIRKDINIAEIVEKMTS